MKYLNYSRKPSDIKAVFIIHPLEFSDSNIRTNLLSQLAPEYQNSVLVLSPEKGNMQEIIDSCNTLKTPNLVITVYDKNLFKSLSGAKTVPKAKGKLVLNNAGRYIQYSNFSSKSLYSYATLTNNLTCIDHVQHFLKYGEPIKTELPRKLIIPKTKEEVIKAFKYLLTKPVIGADIETTSLKFYEAELVSISLAIDEQRGYTFHVKNVDFVPYLIKFFNIYKGRIAWHGGSYDLKFLAYKYFNGDSRKLYRTYEDTLILHYLCTNSPERFPRDLGTLAVDLCGEYKLSSTEIRDMMNVDVQKVCEYNLDDSRSTIWLYKTYRHKIYSEALYARFKEWQWYLTQTELAGMPFSESALKAADAKLTSMVSQATKELMKRPEVIQAMGIIRSIKVAKLNAKRVTQKEEWEYPLEFNPNSNDHLAVLLFDVLKFTPLNKTPSGKPSTSASDLKEMRVKASEEVKPIFEYLNTIAKAGKMKSTFIEALKTSSIRRNGHSFLHGSFNLAKVVSGRLSSSSPNLQNMPSGTELAKVFKSIFSAPEGWLWGGADYSALEERVNTILTNDPNKRAVYLDGYDGHSFRALNYFPDELTAISEALEKASTTEERVNIINSIEDDFKSIRSKGKAPTFLLQYLGTAFGLVKQCGFSQEEADALYDNYYKLYAVSAKWLEEQLAKVAEKGYAELAYGLRIYCYGITQVLLNHKRTPRTVQEYIRTLGNAIGGQSYGQLNVDSGCKFLKRVYAAGLENDVKSVGSIHDATYLMWRDDPVITEWVNRNLIECMTDLSDLPELVSDIPIPAQLEVFLPDWSKPIKLPVNIKAEDITPYILENYAE
ncbi:MAG: DNA polymerase [Shewanella sp.]